jgi:hypothetical protein
MNLVFGGYRTIPFKDENNKQYRDDKAFIFSLTKKTKHIPYTDKDSAICHSSKSLVKFFLDICIEENCDQVANSGAYLGRCYSLPEGMKVHSQSANEHLGGKYSFKVSEMEVYTICRR